VTYDFTVNVETNVQLNMCVEIFLQSDAAHSKFEAPITLKQNTSHLTSTMNTEQHKTVSLSLSLGGDTSNCAKGDSPFVH